MARSRTKPESTDRTAPESGPGPGWFAPVAWGVGLAGTAIGLAVWVPKLLERTTERPLPAPIRVVLGGAPDWLPADERTAMQRAVLRSVGSSPFDRDGLAEAREAVRRCGWMPEVTQVRRSDVDEVVVEGTWAIPFALVCDAQGEHLVDTRGRLLPRQYPAGKGPRLMRILGASTPRPAAFGEAWQAPEVSAARGVAALMADRPWRRQVATVDMTAFSRDGTIRFATDTGCAVVWGRAPGEESASEVPSTQKLAVLQLAFDRTGRIDAGQPTSIDLRGDFTLVD
jgi:hypothetical protein